jgi:hypothetical protein
MPAIFTDQNCDIWSYFDEIPIFMQLLQKIFYVDDFEHKI